LKAYGALFCNWKWIKWFRRLLQKIFFSRTLLTTPLWFFVGIYKCPFSMNPLQRYRTLTVRNNQQLYLMPFWVLPPFCIRWQLGPFMSIIIFPIWHYLFIPHLHNFLNCFVIL
jgi:hypothetical protein